ncbi:MAG: aspartate aminotransferase family protein, partial [Dehalococcoidia bacterium]
MAGSRPIDDEYAAQRPSSQALYKRARDVFPGGVTHDARYATPFPIYVERAQGARKWDVDGHEYVDYWMGHGALLLGHAHPALVETVSRQVRWGTHLGACHELEVQWGQLIQRLMPSVQRLRFTSSGTEAVQMALRLARAHSGRPMIVKLAEHFHGWLDSLAPGDEPPGIPRETRETVITVPPDDIEALADGLARDDVAGLILEPSGAHMGGEPLRPGYLQEVRDLTRRRGVLLIFDEVVTGFRWSAGGVQGLLGITPDLTTFGKIVAGGLPGAAVGGASEVMAALEFGDATGPQGHILHPGTFNANPLSAAAGIAMLTLVSDGEPPNKAAETARALAQGMNAALARHGVDGCVYGESSILHVLIGPGAPRAEQVPEIVARGERHRLRTDRAMAGRLRRAMLVHGVDLMGSMMIVSAVHTGEDVQRTVDAFDRSLTSL